MTSNRFMIFGAPGAGKSTLIRYLALKGDCFAVDLEDVGGSESDYSIPFEQRAQSQKRYSLLNTLAQTDFNVPVFIGAADMAPEHFPQHHQIIFLHYRNRDAYFASVANRDAKRPEKANQDYAGMYGHMERYREMAKPPLEFDPSDFADAPDELALAIWGRIDPERKSHPRR